MKPPALRITSALLLPYFQVIAGAHDIYDRTAPVQVRAVLGVHTFQPADVAIIKLNSELTLSSAVKPVSLAADGFIPAGYICYSTYCTQFRIPIYIWEGDSFLTI